MRRLKLSYLLILLALGLVLSQPNLNAIASAESQQKSADHKKSTATHKSGTENQPLFIKILPSSEAESAAREEKEEKDAKRKTDEDLVKFTEQLAEYTNDLAQFTKFLVGVGVVQIFIFIAQCVLIYRQEKTTKTIERAYVKMSHFPPGMHFEQGGRWWVRLQVKNAGRTPSRVTMVVLCGQYMRPGFNPPSIPDYSDGVQQPGGAFLVPEEHVSFMAQGEFPIDVLPLMRQRQGRFLLFGYVDYIDQFGGRHRAGYAREYSADLDNRESYLTTKEFTARSNLTFVHESTYNYDKPRDKGDGNDWNQPI